MSLEKLYNYVCGIMERSIVQVDAHDAAKMQELLPHAIELKSEFSRYQLRMARLALLNLQTWPQPAQELELFVVAERLKRAIAAEQQQTCNKCGCPTDSTVPVAIGSDTFTCCQPCADKISEFIMGD